MAPVVDVARVEYQGNGLTPLQDYGKTDRHLWISRLNASRREKPAWARGRSTPLSRHRHRLMAQAILIGLLTGAVAVCFHLALDYGELLRNRILDFARRYPEWGPSIVLSLALIGVMLSATLVIRIAPEAAGSGIPHLKIVLQGRRPFRWLRVLIVKFVSTVVGVTGGLVLGRGGPSVHMGGAIGQGVANLWPGKHSEDRPILLAAGGGAGLSAAFNSPLAGLVFVLEELEWRFASLEFFTTAVACLAADMVCRAVLGQYPTFHLASAGSPPLTLLPAFVPVGILSALLGALFNRSLLTAQSLIGLRSWPRLAWWLILASMVTVVGWRFPTLLGSGQDFVDGMLEGSALPPEAVALFFLIRFILTIGSSSSGAAGGLFIPILVLGALLGWGVGETIRLFLPELNVDSRLFAVVGMAAYFTGVVHAPLTAIVLIIEMTGNYTLILPLFIACFSALLVADWAGSLPLYEALLENDWRKDRFKRVIDRIRS
ncbi:H(+)/Cl(-) exchange transporter ClcA [Methylococcus sp. EFPC2]|uniref:H(+)/Cl(-) exchange transporter ClcA n=1 Tax=Methylococcus sp. EFPC2 TaxID=2812648 RepID=UPI0019670E7E|nr:H(+)/Cl(-) exchange transporter ClcA [Methylococcus sp. EFPC2]QSA97478.1 H(+)/Cl(-) exchange transporter ClcA [Methylococcus sp. EFPC2]